MNFSEQQSKLSRLLGDSNQTDSDQWPTVDRKFEINRGEVQFARDSKSLLGYTTGVVASQAITVPSDWLETYALTITEGGNDKNVEARSEISIHDIGDYQDLSDEDYFYFWVDSSGNRQIKFVSSSSDGETYKLWYFRKPTTALDEDSDESVHPDEYREASVYYAASELLEQVGKTQLAERYRAKYQYFVDTAILDSKRNYVNTIRPFPELMDSSVHDVDVQGRGQQEYYGTY